MIRIYHVYGIDPDLRDHNREDFTALVGTFADEELAEQVCVKVATEYSFTKVVPSWLVSTMEDYHTMTTQRRVSDILEKLTYGEKEYLVNAGVLTPTK